MLKDKMKGSQALWIVACCIFLVGRASALVQSDERSPNLVFVMADDLGYGDLGCFGQKRIRTPRLDRMAREGMRLTDFYAGSTVCAPSRCVLMTGKHSGHCFIRGNGRLSLRPKDVTVAEVMKTKGYATGLFGKWGLGEEASQGVPTKQGFDEFYGYLNQRHAHNYWPEFLFDGEKRVRLRNVVPKADKFGAGVATVRKDYSHDLITARALDFVDRHHDKPFFLYLAYTIPHANNEARRKGMEVPDHGQYADKDWPEAQKGQAAMISRLDRDVGRLLDRLAKHGIDEHTLVIFTSDNGPHAEGGNDPRFCDSNGPLRGKKRDLYEGGIRVPTIAWWPGRIAKNSVSERPAYFGDLMATAADLAGAECPEDCDSVSLLPSLTGKNGAPDHEYLYWEFYERGSAQALRQGRYKLIRKPMHDGKVELYDLAEDIGETKNLAGEQEERVARMLALMARAHTPSKRWRVRRRRRK